jgi:hypothetical protein
MRHQLRLCADHGGQSGPEERATPCAEPPGDGEAGTAGLWWLWSLVELRLGAAESDSAA